MTSRAFRFLKFIQGFILSLYYYFYHFILSIFITLFLILPVILVVLDKQEDDWKPGWMYVTVKLKMKRFTTYPLLLIVGLIIIILILQKLV